ncbi:carbohydrate binding domain-containing protein [bacterium]|nr:carbohydrate binding domain-containing protein [bacterium]
MIRPLLWGIVLVLAVLLVGAALEFVPRRAPDVEWIGPLESHDRLGFVYRPYSILKTYYADNPRGYFKLEDPREKKWWLRAERGSIANLVFPSDNPESVRVEIKKIQSASDFDVQLNLQHLPVNSTERYRITFRARTDQPRSAFVGFARGDTPWTGLGLYNKIELTPEWRTFQHEFTATDNEKNARIHFDLGGSDISIDLSSVNLVRLSDNRPVPPETPSPRYFVSYRFNQQGCRGRDYVNPKPDGTLRILVLDGSFTLGVGVYEEDTFAFKLEQRLNQTTNGSGFYGTYDVINCGIHGYGISENRMFYQLYAAKYQPDIVLLILPRFWEESLWAGFEPAGRIDRLVLPWANMPEHRADRPTPDLAQPVDEIVQLNNKVRESGGRLAVVLFRIDSDYEGKTDSGEMWNDLTSLISLKLKGTDVPLFDVGKSLFKRHSYEELVVYSNVDQHPNEIAHAIVAAELQKFLRVHKLVRQ